MRQLTFRQQIISSVLKIIVIVAAVLGTVMCVYAGRNSFMGGRTVFMFFTIQSNLALALLCLIGLIWMIKGDPFTDAWYTIKFIGTISITLTGLVFCFVLAPTMRGYAWSMQNVLTHVIVPIVSVLDFFVTGLNSQIKKWNAVLVIIPPILYAIYAGIGYVNKWEFAKDTYYPYFFLNWGSEAGAFGFSKEMPFMGCAWWILALFVLLIFAGFVYLWILDGLKKLRSLMK